MPRLSRAAGAALLALALASCHRSHSVYIADRVSPERIHAGARSYFAKEGYREQSWDPDDLSGEFTHEKAGRKTRLLLRPLGDGWNLDLRCYDAAGDLEKRETGRLRDRLLEALRDEGLPAREGPF
ncbi:MAG: hypothetical protein IPN34_04095 [Planctomycetes bacterium]|nr:hypothetical protein [Planctomycetota bacterium]